MRGMQNLFVTGKKARGDKFKNGSLSVWFEWVDCKSLLSKFIL
jgi:hypothetical protein